MTSTDSTLQSEWDKLRRELDSGVHAQMAAHKLAADTQTRAQQTDVRRVDDPAAVKTPEQVAAEAAVKDAEQADERVAKHVLSLRDLLDAVLRSGQGLPESPERTERQRLALAVADKYTRLTGTIVATELDRGPPTLPVVPDVQPSVVSDVQLSDEWPRLARRLCWALAVGCVLLLVCAGGLACLVLQAGEQISAHATSETHASQKTAELVSRSADAEAKAKAEASQQKERAEEFEKQVQTRKGELQIKEQERDSAVKEAQAASKEVQRAERERDNALTLAKNSERERDNALTKLNGKEQEIADAVKQVKEKDKEKADAVKQAKADVAAAVRDKAASEATTAEMKVFVDRLAADTDPLDAKLFAAIPDEKLRKALAIERCLTGIRACQLKSKGANGAFRLRSDQTALVQPESNPRVALALLVAHDRVADLPERQDDLKAVGQWIDWYAGAQSADGSVAELSGTEVKLTETARVTRAGAGEFLVVCDRFQQVTKMALSDKQRGGAVVAANSIRNRIDAKDKLTWNDASLPVDQRQKFVITCITDAAGLRAAGQLLKESDQELAAACRANSDALVKGLRGFCREKEVAFDSPLGTPLAETADAFPTVNLYGLAWISPDKDDLRKRLSDKFQKKQGWQGVDPTAPPELWLMATPKGHADRDALEAECVRQALTFTRMNTYVVRPANVLLALLEGDKWMGLEPSATK